MAKIYEEKEVTQLYHSVGEPAAAKSAEYLHGYARQMDQEAQQYERQAKQTYSTALKISASDTMNQLYSQYSDDPVRLQAEFKKAYDKSIGEIVDDDVKVDFMANVTLQSQTYITKAIENKKKKDYRIMKSTTFDGIDKNTQTLGLAFSTLLGDDFNPDNVGVYNIAMSNNNAMINKLNDDGTYMFTDEQRKRMTEDMDKAHLFALKQNYDDMPSYQKDSYMKLLMSDKIEVPVGLDKDKNIVKKNLRDVISYDSYEKFKDYAEKVYKQKEKLLDEYGSLDPDEADKIALARKRSIDLITSSFDNIEQDRKDGNATERLLKTLELDSSIQSLDLTKLSKKDKEKYMTKSRQEMISALKNPANKFDEFGFDSALSVGVQTMKNDGLIGGGDWSDDMSVVAMREFYTRVKESNLDLRANDSGSRDAAKSLMHKAVKSTIDLRFGGDMAEYNSRYIYGRKVSPQPIERATAQRYVNTDYAIKGGTKVYNETGINLIPENNR